MSAKELNNSVGQGGWTLLEMLVVICIIGILAAASLVSYGPAKTEAYNAQALNDVKNAATACQTCCFKGCSQCVLGTDLDGEQAVKCQECYYPSDEVTRYVLSSYDVNMTLQNEPITCGDVKMIGAFHQKGDKTFCLHEDTGDLDSHPGHDLLVCN